MENLFCFRLHLQSWPLEAATSKFNPSWTARAAQSFVGMAKLGILTQNLSQKMTGKEFLRLSYEYLPKDLPPTRMPLFWKSCDVFLDLLPSSFLTRCMTASTSVGIVWAGGLYCTIQNPFPALWNLPALRSLVATVGGKLRRMPSFNFHVVMKVAVGIQTTTYP